MIQDNKRFTLVYPIHQRVDCVTGTDEDMRQILDEFLADKGSLNNFLHDSEVGDFEFFTRFTQDVSESYLLFRSK